MTAIPTAQTNATAILKSYVYRQFSDDDNIQAFATVFNEIVQGYLDWFNETPLSLYTAPTITGLLLDWIGTYLYDIRRPVLGSFSSFSIDAVNSFAVNTLDVNGSRQTTSGSAASVSDDIYKRVLTWWLYAGDGKQMSIDWIKRRVSRFLYGPDGSDIAYPPEFPPSITLGTPVFIGAVNSFPGNTLPVDGSGAVTLPGFVITVPPGTVAQAMQGLIANGLLTLPFEIKFTVILSAGIYNDGGRIALVSNDANVEYPTSPTGLPAGALWSNGLLVCVIPGATPDPMAPPVYFDGLTAYALLSIGGANLPTSNPAVTGQLWNNGGVVSVA